MIERVLSPDGGQLYHHQLPLIYCGAGCGEALRLGEGDIRARENIGHGAPVCPCCKAAIMLEHFASEALTDKRHNAWGYE
jgi:hypothetical protein